MTETPIGMIQSPDKSVMSITTKPKLQRAASFT